MGEKSRKVCMFVLNPCTNDARVLKEADTLGSAGYDVSVIAMASEDAPALKEEKKYFTIYRVNTRRLFDVKRKLARYKAKPLLFIVNKGIETASYLSNAYRLAKGLRADIYHAHDLNTLLSAYLAARKTGAKAVYDSHEFYTERNTFLKDNIFIKWIIRQFESFFIRRVHAVITVNGSIAAELSNLYSIATPSVIMNCPSYHLGARSNLLREMLGLDGDQRIILYIGKIYFNRGLEESITAIKKINNGVLVIMGYGEPGYITGLKEMAETLGVKDKVYIIPPVPADEVVRYASSADIGIVPIQNSCKSYYYCSPNKLFESMMAGLPVAASNFPELDRIIKETDCGCSFDPADPDSISDKINSMISDPVRMAQMSGNAVRCANNYSWEIESKKLLTIYANLVDP